MDHRTSSVVAGPWRNLSELTRQQPVTAFLIGAYLWAWVLWGYWVPAMPAQGLTMSVPFLLCAIIGGFGPSISALLVSAATGGSAAVRQLLASLTHFRVHPAWYAFALLLVPALTVVSLLIQSRVIGSLHWSGGSPVLVRGLVWPIMAALGEELGWRGVLLPRLVPCAGLLGAALLVGLAWGVWHLPADYIGLKGYGDWFWPAFLIEGPFLLTAHAIIMAWLWRRTAGSLLLAVLYHASITASAIIAPVSAATGAPAVAAATITAVLVWAVALFLIVTRWSEFQRA